MKTNERAKTHINQKFITVVVRRPEKPAESATGIIPGNRGMDGDSWCRPPLRAAFAARAGRSHQLLWPESCPVSFHESGAVRQAAIRNRARAESGPPDVSTVGPTQLPRGLWLLLRRPERNGFSRRADPAKRPGSLSRARNGGANAGSERDWQSPSTSSTGAVP
jgi:hypothetical protein